MIDILKLLERDCSLTAARIGAILGRDEREVQAVINRCREENIIIAQSALIDWDKTADDTVTALIEVKISPQRGDGFDRIAERICQYDEVESLYLMSGAFDLTVIIAGKSLKEIANFVFSKLATIDGVTSTATHFILKKYKEKNCMFTPLPEQEERMLFV